MRLLVAFLALSLGSACFVADELEQGNDILDQHGGRKTKAAAEAAAAAEAEPEPEPARAASQGPGVLDRMMSWAGKKLEPAPPPPDPADAPVRCWIGDRQHFATRWDCEARGGRAVELPPASD